MNNMQSPIATPTTAALRDRPFRFAMVTTFYPPYHFGGDAWMVRRLAHALARRGHAVDVIHDADAYRALSDKPPGEILDEPAGVRIHRLQSKFGFLSCLATQQLGRPVVHGRKIARLLAQADVIHYHNVSLVGGPGVLSLGDAIKLYTTHEHWLVCPTHVLWRHNRELCDGRQCLRCVLKHRRPPQLWRATNLLKNQCRHVDAFLAPSQSCADRHREFGFEREMTVLPNFLPDDLQEPAVTAPPPDAPADRPFFLFVGRLERIKGLQDVIPYFRAAGNSELWIAGTGSMEAELRQLAGGSPRVRFLGNQHQSQLRWLYEHALAVVLPSICYEVFPMVVLEAFRCGAPVIARNLGPYPEIIAASGGGLLFQSAEDLAAGLSRLAADRTLRRELGDAGRAAFRARWSETPVLKKYFEVIEGIAAGRDTDLCDRAAKDRGAAPEAFSMATDESGATAGR